MKDKKACIFYFLMTLILLNFGNQIRKISHMPMVDSVSNPVFSILHINNTGSAFSLFPNQAKSLAIFGIFIVIFIAFEVFRTVAFKDKFELLALTLFSAGALGNIIERLKFGHVVDYIKLNFVDFPIFNAFDIMICVGILLYCVCVIKESRSIIKSSK